MDNDQIVSRMNSYLHTSANVLAEWLGSLLPRASDDWWEECVLDKLQPARNGDRKRFYGAWSV